MNPLVGNMNNIISLIGAMRSGADPKAFAEKLMMQNPQFKSFYEANKSKSVEQIANENGIDMSVLQNILNNFK